MGPATAQQTLLTALAMGADKGIHVITDFNLEPFHVAKLFQKIIEQKASASNPISLAILGKQAIDDDANQTSQILAGLLNWPQGTFASKLDMVR